MTPAFRIQAATALMLCAAAVSLSAQQQPATGSQKREAEESEEHAIQEAQVPAAVRNAFRHAWPTARATKYTSEHENGRTVYEIESVDGTVHRDLLLAADGAILETETQVAPAQLPAPVRTAAEAHGAHINVAELVVTGRDTTYEISIRGKSHKLHLRPDGRPAPER